MLCPPRRQKSASIEPLSFPAAEVGRLAEQVRRQIAIASGSSTHDGGIPRGRVASFLRRMALQASRVLVGRQEACNHALLELVIGLTGVVADAHERIEQRFAYWNESWNGRLESEAFEADKFAQEIRREVGRCHLELRSLERKIFSRLESKTPLGNREISSACADELPDELAAAWEDHQFGSRLDLLAAFRSLAEPALSRLQASPPLPGSLIWPPAGENG